VDPRPFVAAVVVLAAVTGCTSINAGNAAPTGPVGTSSAAVPQSAAPSTDRSVSTPAPPTATQQVVALAPGVADEASGITASTRTPGAYFLVDDATDNDHIVAVGADGAELAMIAVQDMLTSNAEALTAGPCGAAPLPDGATAVNCLFIGDIGDNRSRRDDITILRIGEPDLSDPPAEPVLADQWRYTYPDGPRDAEAMMVTPEGAVVIVTKPDGGNTPTRIYRGAPGGGELTFVSEFAPPEPQVRLRTMVTGNTVTDLAAAPGRVLLLTYDELTEYTAPDAAADITGFPDWPHHRLPVPSLAQAEGVTAMIDSCGYVVASEAGPGGKHGSLGVVSCG